MMQTISAGSINERGFINSLDRQGFTLTKSGCEMIANSLDACSSTVLFVNNHPDNITIIDDGKGMFQEKLVNMVDIFRENNAENKSMGVSGMGGSAASFQLSKFEGTTPRSVTVYTKHIDDSYLTAFIPWDVIFRDGVFTGQVKIRKMTTEEIQRFVDERNENGMHISGTTFVFHYSETFCHLLDEQFSRIENPLDLKDSWGVVFGKVPASIKYNKRDGTGLHDLKKYDYFSGSDNEYYTGLFRHFILHIYNQNGSRFLTPNPDNEDEYLEITKSCKGLAQKPKPVNIHPLLLENADVISFTSGMRIDTNVFDIEHPEKYYKLTKEGTEILTNGEYCVNSYDSQFMTDSSDTQQFCGQIGIYRNSQRITGFVPEGYSLSSARGNGDSMAKMIQLRACVEYEVYSKQNNQIDKIHGIQQNKNQNQNEFPKTYTRLVKFLKDYHYARIKRYMLEVYHNRVLVPEPPVTPVTPQPVTPVTPEPVTPVTPVTPIVVVEPPPVLEPPVLEPPVLEPPVLEPPVLEPPVLEPPVVARQVLPIFDSPADLSQTIERSRNYLTLAAQRIMEIAADPDYKRLNGQEIYDLVENLIR